jgi:hypothetical protein
MTLLVLSKLMDVLSQLRLVPSPPQFLLLPCHFCFELCCIQVSDSAVFDTDVVTSLRSPQNKL